tara:strand:+ start:841 stop:1098 length:258 start_codon:yes stop_codon:yes gene_type:complete
MALEKKTKVDNIGISGDFKIINCRTVNEIWDGDELISKSYLRSTYTPDRDVSEAPAEVQEQAALLWTKDVKDAFIAFAAIKNAAV